MVLGIPTLQQILSVLCADNLYLLKKKWNKSWYDITEE